jgi:type IV pilus assembly protein PilP
MKVKTLTLMCLASFALIGCESQIDEVNLKMAEIRSQPPLPIDPTPSFDPAPVFPYSAFELRSPFMQNSLATELRLMAGKRVYPNLSRTPQPLESYSLESLSMKGSLKNSAGQIVALIQTPDRDVERVQVGSYMGSNFGRVVKITPTQIDLIEIIPDGRDGYVERPRSLVLIGLAP